MKVSNLFVASVLALSCQAQAGQTFKCMESVKDARAEGRLQYGFVLKTLEKVAAGRHDIAERVKVTLYSRDPEVASSRLEQDGAAIEATAYGDDVEYRVHDKRTGLDILIFLDELDQTAVQIKGVSKHIHMNCQ